MPSDTRSDEQLVTAFLAGSPACQAVTSVAGRETALDTLLDRYQEPLWRYAYKISHYRDKSFIDDIRQRSLIAIFQGLKTGRFDPAKGTFKDWAYGICHTVCLDENQKYERHAQVLSERYPLEFPDDILDERAKAPDVAVEEAEESDRISRVLLELSEEDRALCQLALIEDKSYEEIARSKPFERYRNRLPALRQKTCALRKHLVSLLKTGCHRGTENTEK